MEKVINFGAIKANRAERKEKRAAKKAERLENKAAEDGKKAIGKKLVIAGSYILAAGIGAATAKIADLIAVKTLQENDAPIEMISETEEIPVVENEVEVEATEV